MSQYMSFRCWKLGADYISAVADMYSDHTTVWFCEFPLMHLSPVVLHAFCVEFQRFSLEGVFQFPLQKPPSQVESVGVCARALRRFDRFSFCVRVVFLDNFYQPRSAFRSSSAERQAHWVGQLTGQCIMQAVCTRDAFCAAVWKACCGTTCHKVLKLLMFKRIRPVLRPVYCWTHPLLAMFFPKKLMIISLPSPCYQSLITPTHGSAPLIFTPLSCCSLS